MKVISSNESHQIDPLKSTWTNQNSKASATMQENKEKLEATIYGKSHLHNESQERLYTIINKNLNLLSNNNTQIHTINTSSIFITK